MYNKILIQKNKSIRHICLASGYHLNVGRINLRKWGIQDNYTVKKLIFLDNSESI